MGNGLSAVIRESTKPGQITVTAMPSGARLGRSASPQLLTAALLAE